MRRNETMNLPRLANKTALVTGGSEGIGLAIATAFVNAGAQVTLVGRSAAKLEAAQRTLGADVVRTVAADLATSEGVDCVVQQVLRSKRALDILVNNAGTAVFAPFAQTTARAFDEAIDLNLRAVFFLTQGMLDMFPSTGASVINMSSYFARKMLPGRPSSLYSLSKGALNSLTLALAYELGPRGIRVNAIAPGTVDTPLRRRTIATLPAADQAELQRFVEGAYPLRRIGAAADVAGMAVHLASDESAWTTGGIFAVDGGLTTG
jgi:NAD(P)-dependent dehydrogenase (short-subunit alcohol dehydrogenase family)